MKIRTKVLIALGTLPLFLITLIVSSLYQKSNLDEFNHSLQENFELTVLTEQIHRDIKDEGILLRNLVIYNDEQTIQEEIASLTDESESIITNIALLESLVKSTEQKTAVAELKAVNSDFNEYKEQVIAFVEADEKEKALSLIDENSKEIHQQFFSIIKEITTKFETNMDSEIENSMSEFQSQLTIIVVILTIVIVMVTLIITRTVWTLSTRLTSVASVMREVANGNRDLDTKVEVNSTDEIGEVAQSFNRMTSSLDIQIQKEQELTWAKSNIANITTSLTGTNDIESLAKTFLSEIVPLVGASHAVFFAKESTEEDMEPVYRMLGSYALKERKHLTNTFKPGEGLIGQAVIEKSPIILTEVPENYISIKSGIGEAAPLNVYVLPIQYEGDVKAVLEVASFKAFTPIEQSFLEDLMEDLGIILESVMGRIQLAKLLEESQALMEETQAQSEELQSQQEELRATNEELEEQTMALKQSEERLQMQQEELEEINANLEEKTKSLEEQNKQFERKNKEVEAAKMELEEKAEQLALSSKYKSEFLANMSHELRTPLNSLLILSKLLTDNKEGNLSEKQKDFARTIYSSGNDLLTMINDILDLAKIESGKVEVYPSNIEIKNIIDFVEATFSSMAEVKGLGFRVNVHENVPKTIYSDEIRIQQVLKNLLSNAFKFTEKGEVVLDISIDPNEITQPAIIFSVQDTGIGIAKEKQELIFEAFQQADGTTSRKFGGTGLGLSIAKESAALLGGEIKVSSVVGKGTTFTFTISSSTNQVKDSTILNEVAATNEKVLQKPSNNERKSETNHPIEENSHIKRVLIVDDDKNQRNSIMELIGDMDLIFKAVSTGTEAIEELKVNSFDCMILDLGLSDTSGFDLLKHIKQEDETSDVKVIVYTGRALTSKEELDLNKYAHTIIIKDEQSPFRLKEELSLFLKESTSEIIDITNLTTDSENDFEILKGKKVLVVDDDIRNVFALSSILEQFGMNITFAENGVESLEVLNNNPNMDIVLMDIMMPEMDGYEAMRQIRSNRQFINLPIIALTAKAMKDDREKCLEAGASDYIVKPIDSEQLISLIKVWLYQQEGN